MASSWWGFRTSPLSPLGRKVILFADELGVWGSTGAPGDRQGVKGPHPRSFSVIQPLVSPQRYGEISPTGSHPRTMLGGVRKGARSASRSDLPLRAEGPDVVSSTSRCG